jgi:hypothetical protein
LFVVALPARPDTLVLRNGSSVTGAWAGVTASEISFLVDSLPQKYVRSDVLSVSFGPATPAPAPTKTTDPELIGVLYFADAAAKLVPLERTRAQLKRIHWEVEGAASSVHLTVAPKLSFVVSLAVGIDPGIFSLIRLESSKGARQAKFNPVTLPINVTKFGAFSYSLSPAADLAPGEYAFIRKNTNDFHCFSLTAP